MQAPAKRPWRWLRIVGWAVAWPLLLVALVLAALWYWAASDQSLSVALERAAGYLPPGQTLQTSEVSGSLLTGGRIGLLRWRGAGLEVEAREIEVGWRLPELWQRKLTLSHLRIDAVSAQSTGPASTEPFVPPEQIVLPIQADIPFTVGQLRWAGPPVFDASGLAGRYVYDGAQHALQLDGVRVADGSYSGRATLQARAPLALALDLQAEVRATVPETTRTLTLSAQGSARGELGGAQPALQIQAALHPAGATPAPLGAQQPRVAPGVAAARARLEARVHPWAEQPLQSGDASFEGIDAASFWPGAPTTLLAGHLRLQPAGSGWDAEGEVRNGAAGPWDRGRVPADQVEARLRYRDGTWHADTVTARAGSGEIQLRGEFQNTGPAGAANAPPRWQARAELRQLDPARLHTQFAPASLSGRVQARSEGKAIAFEAAVQPAAQQPKASPLQGLRLREVAAQGRWAEPVLELRSLRLRTDDAKVEGRLELDTRSRAGRGALQFALPGAQAEAQGHLSADQGEGTLTLRVADTAKAVGWIAQWPGVPGLPAGLSIQGQGELDARWQGGWNSWQPTAAPARAAAPGLQARLSVPRLDIATAGQPPESALHLRQLRAEAKGPLNAIELALQGELASGTARVDLKTQATGGRQPSGAWQARFAQLSLRLQDGARPGVWTAELRQPVEASLRTEANGLRLETGAGELALSGPAPGTARIVWQPLSYRTAGSAHELRSQGRIEDLPMAWLDALAAAGGGPLANVGLSGDMVFAGSWNLLAAETLRLEATLERRSGDLRVVADETGGERIEAGVREAQARLTTEGDTVRLAVRWDSERAGQVQADLSTRMARADGAWRWPEDAPLAGKLQARLPRVGAWSMLAPPGWRMRGTLEADATLAGTRQSPRWNGRLQADDLALRSVVEGIELRDGRLRATLQGQRLELTEFVLYGAPVPGGAPTSGGALEASGAAIWSATQGVQANVTARARALRVSIRSDRQLTVSGELQARAQEQQLSLRGQLKADHALFLLPDETTPTLGSDVVVRSAAARQEAAAKAQKAAERQAEPPPGRWKTDVRVAFALGDDFRIRGRGLATQLTGELELTATPGTPQPLRVAGELRTFRGSYRAYGQSLDIEQGILRFSGPYDNPALDVLAIRPNLTQRVGVQITGTALSPRIRLYAEPELPDTEKLAWLVLGRSAASGGAEAAVLQQAALALLGGNGRGLSGGLAEALGLDELSFRGASSTGENGTATSAAVTLGKRLSRNFYVAYERSLAGTLGSFYIFYDLSRRLTLRAQTGEKSAVDLIFTVPYD